MDINNLTVCGRLVNNPEITTKNDITVLRFTIANNQKNNTNYISCVAFNKLAELISKYCQKGSRINLIGRIQTRSYDGQDGQKRYVTEVIADNVQFLDTKKDGQATETQSDTQVPQTDPYADMGKQVSMDDYPVNPDDLPF